MQNRSNGDEFSQLLFIWTVFISHSFLKNNLAVQCLVWKLGFLFVCFAFSILNISSDSLLCYKVSASLTGAGVGWLWGPWWGQMLTISFSLCTGCLSWGEEFWDIVDLFPNLFNSSFPISVLYPGACLIRNPCLFWRYFCAWIIVQIDVFEGVLMPPFCWCPSGHQSCIGVNVLILVIVLLCPAVLLFFVNTYWNIENISIKRALCLQFNLIWFKNLNIYIKANIISC